MFAFLMGKKHVILFVAVLLAVSGVVVLLALPLRGPRYLGRTWESWLGDLEQWDGDTNNPAFVAFREMGTNAIPPLLKVLESGGPSLQRAIMKLNQKQNVVSLPYGEPWHQTMAAAWALYAMGSNASPALPALTDLLFRSNILISTTTAMAGIGSEAVPVLLAALTNRDYQIRDSAASGLGWERTDLNIVIPALIASLDDSESLVRSAAAVSLGQLHSEPELTVPA